MSDSLIALVAALTGALIAFLASYFGRLRGEYAARVGAMRVVRSDLTSALKLIEAALCKKRVWPSRYKLLPPGWETHRAELVSRLKSRSWDELRQTVVQLRITDSWAEELRAEKQDWGVKFEENVSERKKEVEASMKVLADTETGARVRHGIGWTAGVVALAACAVALVLTFTSGPALTDSSLAAGLRAEIPTAGRTICDASNELEGAFTCSVNLPSCGGLEASTGGPSCPAQRGLYEVATEGKCFDATLSETESNGAPKPKSSGFWKAWNRLRVLSGCAKG